ncbi:SH3 domain-containing protein [Hymenobacter cellulosivorans]|uniref:SH3 domain-containing protein n=1 Tax=Hymenobacter cellulosivorans TaxID=2932249 RepID=A0ABY4FF37_9BACT|nr:SH3 domain-containing protein [Hymenobacter cellulosivorans]UOQ53051.1 SH3 domain-containing protein [Hymenobacter cellulosivorans]
MKRLLLILLLLPTVLVAQAQVHVRGYYRSNGTYVKPHERTRPNHTVTDNYSYPGNHNPNSITTTTGTTGETPNTIQPTRGKTAPYSGSGTYKVNSSIAPPLRAAPNVSAAEIYSCPRQATVQVLEDAGDIYCKVSVNGHVGYISKNLLVRADAVLPEYTAEPAPEKKPVIIPKPQSLSSVGKYLYKTSFDAPFGPALRDAPSITANEIYACPRTAQVYVLEEMDGLYRKVFVDGYVGYVAKTLLVQP